MSDAGRELWGFPGVYTLEAKCCFYNIFRYDLASLYPNKMSRRKWWIARSCCPWRQNSQVVVKHRMDSESSLGWKGPLNIILSKLPAMSRDIFNHSRLFRTVQPLVHLFGQPVQCSTTKTFLREHEVPPRSYSPFCPTKPQSVFLFLQNQCCKDCQRQWWGIWGDKGMGPHGLSDFGCRAGSCSGTAWAGSHWRCGGVFCNLLIVCWLNGSQGNVSRF